MKDIDEELSAQIRKVFDNFDDGQSDLGWAALRERYPETSKKKLPIWWFSSVAAALILVAGWWLFFGETQKETTIDPQSAKTVKLNDQHQKQNREITIQQKDQPISQNQNTTIDDQRKQPLNALRTLPLVPIKTPPVAVGEQVQPVTEQLLISHRPVVIDNDSTIIIASVKDAVVKPQNNQAQSQTAAQAVATVTPNKTTEDFLRRQGQVASSTESLKKAKVVSKNSFEVFTGTFLNYSGDNDVKVNAGFGLNANIKMSNSVFLAVGAGISQNKMGYNNPNSIAASHQSADAPVYSPSAGSADYTSGPIVTGVKMSAQLLAVDFPIMVKFFPSKKQNFYISTGINSSSYLRQQYTYSYNIVTPSALFDRSAQETTEQVEQTEFKGFDFANSAIIAIGINQNIGANKLIFEPYFKPAIRNMGDKNLRINTVGINLRFNINSNQKK